jgi:hypothetical protein
LRKWRSNQGSGEGKRAKEKSGKRLKYDERLIAAVVDKKIDAKLKAARDTSTQEAEAEAFIASCIQKFADGNLAAPAPTKPTFAATTSPAKAASSQILKSILGRAKNHSNHP